MACERSGVRAPTGQRNADKSANVVRNACKFDLTNLLRSASNFLKLNKQYSYLQEYDHPAHITAALAGRPIFSGRPGPMPLFPSSINPQIQCLVDKAIAAGITRNLYCPPLSDNSLATISLP